MFSMSILRSKVFILRLNLLFVSIEGTFVFWNYLTAPSEAQSVVFLQYSLLRLILLSFVLSLSLGTLFLFAASFKTGWRDQGLGKAIDKTFDGTETFWGLLVWGGLMYFLLFLSDRQLGSLASYREHLYPILLWFFLASLQFLIAILYVRGMGSQFLQKYRGILRPFFIALTLLGSLLVFIILTRVGLTPDLVYWQEAGVPILFHQVLLAWGSCLLLFFASSYLRFRKSQSLNFMIPIALWLTACIVWLSQPARPNFNSLEPAAPNFQSYPFGDALRYDTLAHGYLVGQPIPSDFRAKPLYTFFLALLHLFAGENYGLLVMVQVAVFAVVPVFVYYLTSLLGGRWAGALAALLIIIREKNSLNLSNVIQVAHIKSLLSDFMAMGLMALLIWLVLKWVVNPAEHRGMPLILGGTLGLFVLLRGHPLLLLPFLLIAIWLVLLKRAVLWRQGVPMILVGLFLALIPWLWRNYQTLGRWTLQDANSLYTVHMERLYNLSPTSNLSTAPLQLPGETSEAYYERLRRNIFRYVIEHPDDVAQFITAHYFHNLIYSYVYLPHSLEIEQARTYIKTLPFWNNWKGWMPPVGWALLVINIIVLALGFAYAWKRSRTGIFVPLLLGVGYNLSVSVGRLSGWRFILPVDWITLVFYSIGLMQIFFIVRFILTGNAELVAVESEEHSHREPQLLKTSQLVWLGLIFLSFGMVLAYGHTVFSGNHPVKSAQQLQDEYRTTTAERIPEVDLNDFLLSDQAVIVYGQALYPSFFESDAGLMNFSWPSYQPKPYHRMIFYLIGPRPIGVVLAMENSSLVFPDGAEVIVIGCLAEDDVIEALAVLIPGDPPIQYTRHPLSSLSCPLSETN